MIRKILERMRARLGSITGIFSRFKYISEALATSRGSAPFHVRVPRRTVALRQSFKRLIGAGRRKSIGTFDPLTPVRLQGEEYWRYSAELERALRLPKVRNIAVTGSYGAGKSSFIQSFVEDHEEYNFCFVSLATFSEDEATTDARTAVDLGTSEPSPIGSSNGQPAVAAAPDPLERIEASIVQQLLYSVRDSSIPQTRLKRINHVPAGSAALYSIFLAAAALAVLALCGLPKSLVHLSDHFPFGYILGAVPGLCAAGLLIGLIAISYGVLSSVLGLKLHSVAIKGMSLARSSVMSVLHKQLDEIVYLFERNKIDIVMIEDLDRFSDSSPFTRLREINFIVNSSPSIHRPIHFVYMVRDDLFSSRDRVKFFDYVIPVISVINTDNSRQKILDIMDARGWADKLRPSRYVIEAVSYYVDDMRLLVNILNEYDLMRSILGRNADLDKDKMFAAVVSRCLFPREYAQLLRGRGLLSEIISSYVGWNRGRRSELQLALSDLESKVSTQPHELATAERELRTLVWLAASEREPDYILNSISAIGGSAMNFTEYVRNGLGDDVKPGDALVLDFGPIGTRRIEYRELLGRGQGSLDARMAAAREVAAGSARRLSELRKKLADSELSALSQALKDPSFVAYVAKETAEKNLGPIGFFVTKGLFGEDYFDYSGYFYAGSVSRSDKALMLRVKAGELLPVESRIDDPAEFLKRVNAAELREGRGMLLSIASHIFGRDFERAEFNVDWKEVLFRDSHLHLERLAELIRGMLARSDNGDVIEYLHLKYPAVLLSIVQPGAGCGSAPWREKSVARILSAERSINELVDDAAIESFKEVVSSITDGAQFVSSISNGDRVKDWLDKNGVSFSQIDEVLENSVMDELIRVGALSVNSHNVRSLGRFFNPPLDDGRIGLAWIRSQVESPLQRWLVRDYSFALEAVLEQGGDLHEDVKDVEWIISHINDHAALQLRAVEGLIFNAESVVSFPPHLWARAFTKQRVAINWGNTEKVISSAEGEELQEVVTTLLSSDNSLGLLSEDSESLDKMDGSDVASIVEKMVELSGEHEQGLAKFLARSGVAVKLPDDFDSGLSSASLELLMEEMSGQWCEWLWAAVEQNGNTLLAEYLASCAGDHRALEGTGDVQADTLIEAARLVTRPSAVEQLLSVFIARVPSWSQQTSDLACGLISICDVANSGGATRVLSAFHPLPMLKEAGIGPSCELLARVVGRADWATAKEFLSVTSHSALSGLSSGEGEATLPDSKETVALATSLHSAGLIRKYKRRKGALVLNATVKY